MKDAGRNYFVVSGRANRSSYPGRLGAAYPRARAVGAHSGPQSFTVASHFDYRPRKGNLLLEIRKDQTANFGDGPIYVDGNAHATGVTLITDAFGVQPDFGITVGFVGRFAGSSTQP